MGAYILRVRRAGLMGAYILRIRRAGLMRQFSSLDKEGRTNGTLLSLE